MVENKRNEGSTFAFLLPILADSSNTKTNKFLKEDCLNICI
jgi:hypothetical protein